MTTLLSYKTTLAYLAYLGYNGDTTSALKIIRPKKIGKKIGKVQKDVLLCYVFGSPGSGKVRYIFIIVIIIIYLYLFISIFLLFVYLFFIYIYLYIN